MERPLLTEEELEKHIDEIDRWLKEEKEDWAKENLKTNLNHFKRLLDYYQKGFEEGYNLAEKEAEEELI